MLSLPSAHDQREVSQCTRLQTTYPRCQAPATWWPMHETHKRSVQRQTCIQKTKMRERGVHSASAACLIMHMVHGTHCEWWDQVASSSCKGQLNGNPHAAAWSGKKRQSLPTPRQHSLGQALASLKHPRANFGTRSRAIGSCAKGGGQTWTAAECE